MSEMVYSTFIRCLQEALTNAKRHGNATAIRVTLTFGREQLTLEIQDNGRGDENLTKGFDLQAMTNRLTNVNGRLQMTSSADKGTVILCSVPVFASHAS